ncbi:MAG: hypothetical protein KAI55_04855 [Candidatus Aenigmarchaeota archaeon]|nr:hypothetical protein [Candidatus Aenigmarchaeota archaeon]
MDVIEEKTITNLDAFEIIKKRESTQEAPLSRMQMITLDYLAKTTSQFNEKNKKEIAEKLANEISKLKEDYIIAILNCVPKDEDDVEVLFSKERINLEKSELTQIVQIVKSFIKTKEKKK